MQRFMFRRSNSQSIIALCVLLAVVALLAGYISTILIRHTIRDMQVLHEDINQQQNELHRISTAIEHHLGNARMIILGILYKDAELSGSDISTRSLGELNKAIRELESVLPPDAIASYRKVIDNIASDFVALHYRAMNWRVQHDHAGDSDYLVALATVRDYLIQLQAANETVPDQIQALGPVRQEKSANPDRTKSALHQAHETARGLSSSIRASIADVGRITEFMAGSTSMKRLTATREDQLLPALALLHTRVNALPAGVTAITNSQVDHLAQLIIGGRPENDSPPLPGNSQSSLNEALVYRLELQDEQRQLNSTLLQKSEQIQDSLNRITDSVSQQQAKLQAESRKLSSGMLGKLQVIQVTAAGSFLLIVAVIITAVHRQVRQLTRLKTEAQQANIAKNRLMQRMHDSETRHRILFETVIAALITIDDEGFIESFNPAAEKMFGYQPGEIIGRNIINLIPEQYRRDHVAGMVQLKNTGQSPMLGNSTELTALRKNGAEFPISLAINEMALNERRQYCGIISDISGRLEIENRLTEARNRAEASDRAKSEFLASMSHEIRTPMNGILGVVQLLLGSKLDEQQRLFARSIHRAGNSLLSLINDILDLSRIEAQRLELHTAPFDLRELVTDIHTMFSESANRKGITYTCHYPPGLQDVWVGDEVRLRQVLNNLSANAVKFTRNGKVDLCLEAESPTRDGAILLFTVRDTGIGISPEEKNRIFESFVQADGTTTREFGGSGLGLTICKRLVELMNGEIGVNSTPGQGSEFWFRIHLPCTDRQPLALENTTDNEQLPVLSADILLVEDNYLNQLVARHMLEKLHCRVSIANNGSEALTLLDAHDFDLVLMDCQMPAMDGYQATRQIREREQQRATRHIPIVALTANAMSYDQHKCLSSGMDDYLSKPLTMSALIAALNRQLRTVNSTPALGSQPLQDIPDTKLNPAMLQELNQHTLMTRVIHLYHMEAVKSLKLLQALLSQENFGELARVAHRFKSSNAQIGAAKLAARCEQLTRAAQDGDSRRGCIILQVIEQEYRELVPELDNLRLQVENAAPTETIV
jgi:PAS domain S-box-containing protein